MPALSPNLITSDRTRGFASTGGLGLRQLDYPYPWVSKRLRLGLEYGLGIGFNSTLS